MDKSEVYLLFERYKSGKCTDEELELLHCWLNEAKLADSEISDNEILEELSLIDSQLPLKYKSKYINLFTYWKIAVAILLCSSISYYFLLVDSVKDNSLSNLDLIIHPGKDGAILKFGQGKEFDLDTLKTGELISLDGMRIYVNDQGQLVYSAQGTNSETSKYQVEVPKGEKIELIMPDGSQCWLNSGSKISFTNDFNFSREREVFLEGEAYFKVAHNKNRPFVVTVKGETVRVLGTEFNVKGYFDEDCIKVSLLSGSVEFNQNILNPGETAILSSNNMEIINQNMDDVMGWKNGYFVFSEENLETVMKDIGRWYNVKVTFLDEESKKIIVGGSMSKYENVSKVLQMIQKASDISIRVRDNSIVIKRHE